MFLCHFHGLSDVLQNCNNFFLLPQTSGRSLQEEKLVKTLKSLSWVITDAPGSSSYKIWFVSFLLSYNIHTSMVKFIFVSWPHTQAGKIFLQFILISLTFNYPEKLSVICELEDFTGHFIFPITYKNLKWSQSDNNPWKQSLQTQVLGMSYRWAEVQILWEQSFSQTWGDREKIIIFYRLYIREIVKWHFRGNFW